MPVESTYANSKSLLLHNETILFFILLLYLYIFISLSHIFLINDVLLKQISHISRILCNISNVMA